jgi:diadenosine tetraphosphate (Ap4A) HIT family hydrolase
MDSSCSICRNNNNPKNLLLETKNWLVTLSPDQGYLGRTYVTLKNHKSHLSQLTKDEWYEYAELVKKIERSYSKGLNATLFNWSCLMNNAYQVEQYNPHVHWHLRPRFKDDQKIGTSTFSDPAFGYHYDRDQRNFVDDETFELITKIIVNVLES